jgi:hypothetical protein
VLAVRGVVQAEPPPGAPTAGPLSSGPPPIERRFFVVRFPADRRDAALSALAELDHQVVIRDARETVRAPLSQIAAEPGGAALLVGSSGGGGGAAAARRVPVAAIAAARTLATVEIPDDAYLVLEADTPRDHLPSVFIALLLAAFGAINVAGLIRELRR